MDSAVQGAKHNEDPGGGDVHRIHLLRDEEIERERIEEDRNLEQVLEVVRGIGYLGRREPRERTGYGKILRADLVARDEPDTADVHVHPDEERQKHRREEGTEDCRLRHVVLLVELMDGRWLFCLTLTPHRATRLVLSLGSRRRPQTRPRQR